MTSIKSLMTNWALPDRTQERVQVTLRLNYNQYARLHALKEVFPNRAINDFLNDIIQAGLDEIVEALPSWVISDEDAHYMSSCEEEYEQMRGSKTGPRVTFDSAYQRILMTKSDDDIKGQEAA